MKKHLLFVAVLVATLPTACSNATDSTTTVSTDSTSSAAAPSSAEQATGTGDVSPTGETLVLDEQTTTWFATFCTGFTGLRDSFASVQSDLAGATGTTPQETQAAVAAVITDLGTKLQGLATDTEALPPPTIENGQQMATAAVDGFNDIGAAMIGAADQFARRRSPTRPRCRPRRPSCRRVAGRGHQGPDAFSAIDDRVAARPGSRPSAPSPECSDMAS